MKIKKTSAIVKRMRKPTASCYYPTKHMITRWFNIINNEIFDNGLDPFDDIIICRLRGAWAYTRVYHDITNCDLKIKFKFPDFSTFLITLSHEMVYRFQWSEYGVLNHGKTFYAWRDDFAAHGLPLKRFL